MMRAFYQHAIDALWVLWLSYWVVAAFRAKPVRRNESWAAQVSHLVPLALGLALLLPRHMAVSWLTFRVLPSGPAWFWLGFLLVAAGLALAVAARLWLGGNWSGVVTLNQDHELIRSGPYRWVRHPIYTGILLALMGSAIALGEVRGLLALALFAVAFLRRVALEERLLIEEFGTAYRQYRHEVPALVPWSWRC